MTGFSAMWSGRSSDRPNGSARRPAGLKTGRSIALLIVSALLLQPAARATSPDTRLKDLLSLQGVKPSPLIGYGLVVGLNKTGDKRQTIFSAQSLANMLERFGVDVNADRVKVENIAAVLVTAELSPFAQLGTRLDVTASSVGDARSLQGGTLLPTPLRRTDGAVVAIAQGPLSIGGFGAGAGACRANKSNNAVRKAKVMTLPSKGALKS